MSNFIDTYISATDSDLITLFCQQFVNAIGPEAASDGSLYACIRSNFAIELPSGISAVDAATGAAVVGVWAD